MIAFRTGDYVKVFHNDGNVTISKVTRHFSTYLDIDRESYWQDNGRRFGRGQDDQERIELATEAEVELFG